MSIRNRTENVFWDCCISVSYTHLRSYIPPTKTNESSSIAQAVGNVASTALNAAEEMILGAGGLINPQTHGDDYAEMAWQRKLRNQAKKKKKRGRGI